DHHPSHFTLLWLDDAPFRQLHMHVISTDFQSPCLRNKVHWNSFTTPFFIPLTSVLTMLQSEEGWIHLDTEKYAAMMKTPLKCHQCPATFNTFPALKQHIDDRY